MPYFERTSYTEMVAAAKHHPADAGPSAEQDPSILDLASSVLAEETRNPAETSGPFRVAKTVKRGGPPASMTLALASESSDDRMQVTLSQTDLRGPDGSLIPPDCVTLSPSHVVLMPGTTAEVEVSIDIPTMASPGIYAGRIYGTGSERLAISIEVEVVA